MQARRRILQPGFALRRSTRVAGVPSGPPGPNVENEQGFVPSGVPAALLANGAKEYDHVYLIVHRPNGDQEIEVPAT
jgi:hypothetical protein